MSAIEVKSLRKEFRGPGGETLVAVDDLSFEIEQGEFFTLVGPSGCGKTTTLRCIAGLETPTSGEIVFEGVGDVTDLPANKRELAMMFQNIALYPHMPIIDNISYPLKVRNVGKEERYERAEEAAEVMQISELLDKYPGELSGGQRQRAALARTIVHDPLAFLMDEPLSDLDAKLKVEIRKEIQRIHRRVEQPTIYVTHDQEEAMTMSDRIAVMNNGNIEQIGTPNELYRHPNNRFVAEFIGIPSMNFLRGRIEELNESHGRVVVNNHTLAFDIDYLGADPSTDDVVIGFRPEVLSFGQPSEERDLEGSIALIEQIGDRQLAHISTPVSDGDVQATVPVENELIEDEDISLDIDRDGLYLFDGGTEEILAKGGS